MNSITAKAFISEVLSNIQITVKTTAIIAVSDAATKTLSDTDLMTGIFFHAVRRVMHSAFARLYCRAEKTRTLQTRECAV